MATSELDASGCRTACVPARFIPAWEAVARTPGVLRNTAYAETMRRCIGLSGITVQFNREHMTTKRPPSTPTPPGAVTVSRPFDPSKFNFNRAKREEVVMELTVDERMGEARVSFAAGEGVDAASVDCVTARQPFFINVNPLFDCHSLLVPEPLACHPQVLSCRMVKHVVLAASAFRARPDWRFGFNSLGAWASVNHFHVHNGCVGGIFPSGAFPVEAAPRTTLSSVVVDSAHHLRLSVHALGWALPGFVFSVARHPEGKGEVTDCSAATLEVAEPTTAAVPADPQAPTAVDVAAATVLQLSAGKFLEHLVAANIAHTVLVAGSGTEFYIMPRQPQSGPGAEGGQLVIALAEACGLGIVYSEDDFAGYTEERYMDALAAVALAPEELMELQRKAEDCVQGAPAAVAASA